MIIIKQNYITTKLNVFLRCYVFFKNIYYKDNFYYFVAIKTLIQHLLNDNFIINNGVLESKHYKPEILFIGTFNPNTCDNEVDFFYGRNCFWLILFNVFNIHIRIEKRRDAVYPLNPSLIEIINFMKDNKIIFADILHSIKVKNYIDKNLSKNFNYNNETYYLNLDAKRVDKKGLTELINLENVTANWNTENIIKIIEKNPTIKKIFFTRKTFEDIPEFKKNWHKILNLKNTYKHINFEVLKTPKNYDNIILKEWKDLINPNNQNKIINTPPKILVSILDNDLNKNYKMVLEIICNMINNCNLPVRLLHLNAIKKRTIDNQQLNNDTIFYNSQEIQNIANHRAGPACTITMNLFEEKLRRNNFKTEIKHIAEGAMSFYLYLLPPNNTIHKKNNTSRHKGSCNCCDCLWERIISKQGISLYTKNGKEVKHKVNSKNEIEWVCVENSQNNLYNQSKDNICDCIESRKNNLSPSQFPGTATSYKWALLNNSEIWVIFSEKIYDDDIL